MTWNPSTAEAGFIVLSIPGKVQPMYCRVSVGPSDSVTAFIIQRGSGRREQWNGELYSIEVSLP